MGYLLLFDAFLARQASPAHDALKDVFIVRVSPALNDTRQCFITPSHVWISSSCHPIEGGAVQALLFVAASLNACVYVCVGCFYRHLKRSGKSANFSAGDLDKSCRLGRLTTLCNDWFSTSVVV